MTRDDYIDALIDCYEGSGNADMVRLSRAVQEKISDRMARRVERQRQPPGALRRAVHFGARRRPTEDDHLSRNAEIAEVCGLAREALLRRPTLRLGQLLSVVAGSEERLFSIEDDELINAILKKYI